VKRIAISSFFLVLFSTGAFAQNGAVYSDTAPNLFLFRDLRARNVNDILNIVIVENSTAHKFGEYIDAEER